MARTSADTERFGNWVQTFTGKQFWPLDPRPEEIDIRDIAHALANTCRFNGHCTRFYSVAEHCVVLTGHAPEEHRLVALLHDAAEAYIADVPRPLKPYLAGYKDIEKAIDECIAERFGLPFPWPGIVHELDNRILADEQEQVMAEPPADWRLPLPKLNTHLPCWSPKEAEIAFLCCYEYLAGEHVIV